MGKVLFMRKGETHTAPVSYKANFADNDWYTIIDACKKNTVPETWLVGDQKNMTIGGTDYAIDIIGKNHDDYADGSGKAPLTFQMHDCYGTTYGVNATSTNVGGWTDCDMRSTYLPSIFTFMPLEVQKGLKDVSKKTSAGSQSSTINTTADKMFLLSEIEVFGTANYSVDGEGSQYDYYKAGNSKVKKVNGTASNWWTRSPDKSASTAFCEVFRTGATNSDTAGSKYGVSFAFCF